MMVVDGHHQPSTHHLLPPTIQGWILEKYTYKIHSLLIRYPTLYWSILRDTENHDDFPLSLTWTQRTLQLWDQHPLTKTSKIRPSLPPPCVLVANAIQSYSTTLIWCFLSRISLLPSHHQPEEKKVRNDDAPMMLPSAFIQIQQQMSTPSSFPDRCGAVVPSIPHI